MKDFSKPPFPVLVGLACLGSLAGLGLFGLCHMASSNPAGTAPIRHGGFTVAVPGDRLEQGWHLAFDGQDLVDPHFVVPPRSEVPNGGLVIDEKSLWWGDMWEVDQFLERGIVLENPTDRDLHVVFKNTPCGSHVHPDKLTVPARGQATVGFGVLASSRDSASRRESFEFHKKLVPRIEEYPGRHPGWSIRGHVSRAIAVDELVAQECYQVTPLRDIGFATADIGGDRSGITIEGPDASGRYLVRIDGSTRPTDGSRTPVSIRGRFAFGGFTERTIWLDPLVMR